MKLLKQHHPLLIQLQRCLYAGGMPKQKATAALASQPKSKEVMPERDPYHVPLRTLETHKLPPRWGENEVLC